jgi:hypothetical protein
MLWNSKNIPQNSWNFSTFFILFFRFLLVIYDTSSIREPPKVLKLMGIHLIDPKSSEICPFFLVRRKLPFFGQNCSLPFSLRSLDNPALLKSGQKHYNWLVDSHPSLLSVLRKSSSSTDVFQNV